MTVKYCIVSEVPRLLTTASYVLDSISFLRLNALFDILFSFFFRISLIFVGVDEYVCVMHAHSITYSFLVNNANTDDITNWEGKMFLNW